MAKMLPRILITPGEPAGIGPDIVLQIAQLSWEAELIVIADSTMLLERAALFGRPLSLFPHDFKTPPQPHVPGTLKIHSIPMAMPSSPGILEEKNAAYVIETLKMAADFCQHYQCSLVTGPVHKGILNQAGFAFQGHTEFLAAECGVPLTVMLFVIDQLRVALATTHLPLADVPFAITQERLTETIILLHNELKKRFQIEQPHLFISGLNPHAGEGGYLGHEEIETIIPTLQALQNQGYRLTGPLPADTLFTPFYLSQADAILGMYHDQVLPVLKYIGFDKAVNVTLGLPFIRTSVDHGTALNIAHTNQADAGSLMAAIKLAITLQHH